MKTKTNMAQQGEQFKYLHSNALSSPRNLSDEDKIRHADQYRIKSKEFGDLVNEYVLLFVSICRLTNKLYTGGKGSSLVFDMGNENMMVLKYKHIISAQKLFRSALLKLKNFYRGSRKRPIGSTTKNSVSAIGAPVYFGDKNNALHSLLLREAEFGPITPDSNQSLISQLPGIQAGYGLRTTVALLFFVHAMYRRLANETNAQFITSSQAMMECFDGMPAKFNAVDSGKGELIGDFNVRKVKAELSPMAPGQQISTYQVLRNLYRGKSVKSGKKGQGLVSAEFEPKRFATYHFQLLISLNSYSAKRLFALGQETGEQTYQDPYIKIMEEGTLEQLRQDHEMVQAARDAWKGFRDETAAHRAEARKQTQKSLRKTESERKKKEKLAMEVKRDKLMGIVQLNSPRN